MAVFVNRAKMSTATTGTGTITLGSAISGYQSFADAGVTDGQIVRYVIEDGSDWEVGSGTYTASGTTLTRSVDESSNADSAINLSGSAVVFVTASASDLQELITFAETFTLPTSDGTADQVLKTDGSGVLSFADGGGGGGAYIPLAVETLPSNASAIDISLPSGYSKYRIIIEKLHLSSAATLQLQTSSDGGSTFDSGSTDYQTTGTFLDAGAQTITHRDGWPQIELTKNIDGFTATNAANGFIDIVPSDGTYYTYVCSKMYYAGGGNDPALDHAIGYRQSSTAVDAIRFLVSGGLMIVGVQFHVYGIADGA